MPLPGCSGAADDRITGVTGPPRGAVVRSGARPECQHDKATATITQGADCGKPNTAANSRSFSARRPYRQVRHRVRARLHRPRAWADRRNVAAARQFEHDADRLRRDRHNSGRVFAAAASPRPARSGRSAWGKLTVAPQRLDADGVALDAVLLAAQRCLHDVAHKGGELRRAAKHLAREHCLRARAGRRRDRVCARTGGSVVISALPAMSVSIR